MVTTIRKLGNGRVLPLTKEILNAAGIKLGNRVKVCACSGRIVVEPLTKVRGRYDLKKLVLKIPRDNRVEEICWGPPVGREAW